MPIFFLRCGLDCLFFYSIFFHLKPPPPPTHMNSAVFLNIGLTQTCISNDVPPFPPHGNLTKAPRERQGNAKLIVRNNVFECTILLKIEVMEYEKWVSKWLEMHSRDILFPRRCLRRRFKPLAFSAPHSSTTPLGPGLFCTYISLYLVYGNVLCMIQTLI